MSPARAKEESVKALFHLPPTARYSVQGPEENGGRCLVVVGVCGEGRGQQ